MSIKFASKIDTNAKLPIQILYKITNTKYMGTNLIDWKYLLIDIIILFGGCATLTPPNLSTEERIDELFEQMKLANMPGLRTMILILKASSILLLLKRPMR